MEEQDKLQKLEESHTRNQAAVKRTQAKVNEERKLKQVVAKKLKKGEEVGSPLLNAPLFDRRSCRNCHRVANSTRSHRRHSLHWWQI